MRCGGLLEQFGDGAFEARDDVFAGEGIGLVVQGVRAVEVVCANGFLVGVDQPDQADAGIDVLLDLGLNVVEVVVGREDLSSQIGDDRAMAFGEFAVGKTTVPNEGDVWFANFAGVIGKALEAGIGSGDRSEVVLAAVSHQVADQSYAHMTRLVTEVSPDQVSLDEFVVDGIGHVQEIVR